MKKNLLITLLVFASYGLFSQSFYTVDYYNWSDPMTFQISPKPRITGYGYYSDSLSKMLDGKTFYYYNDEYYLIESWADYYFWFTRAYWFRFEDPQLYAYYYWAGDDRGMASYIASYKYRGKYYPSSIFLAFVDKPIENNRLSTDESLPTNNEKIDSLKKELEYVKEKIEIRNNDFIKKEAPKLFNKEDFRKKEFKKEQTNTETELKDESSPKTEEFKKEDSRKREFKKEQRNTKTELKDESSPKTEEFKKEDSRKKEYKKEQTNTKTELKDEPSIQKKEVQSSPKSKNEIK